MTTIKNYFEQMNQYLLIDDDDIFNFLHSEVIKQVDASAEIISHSSSIEALDYLKELIHDKIQLPNFIFIDIRMPELNGFELVDELMKFPKEVFDNSKIFFVTSSLDKMDKFKASDYPIIQGFKEKTITTELLKDIQ